MIGPVHCALAAHFVLLSVYLPVYCWGHQSVYVGLGQWTIQCIWLILFSCVIHQKICPREFYMNARNVCYGMILTDVAFVFVTVAMYVDSNAIQSRSSDELVYIYFAGVCQFISGFTTYTISLVYQHPNRPLSNRCRGNLCPSIRASTSMRAVTACFLSGSAVLGLGLPWFTACLYNFEDSSNSSNSSGVNQTFLGVREIEPGWGTTWAVEASATVFFGAACIFKETYFPDWTTRSSLLEEEETRSIPVCTMATLAVQSIGTAALIACYFAVAGGILQNLEKINTDSDQLTLQICVGAASVVCAIALGCSLAWNIFGCRAHLHKH